MNMLGPVELPGTVSDVLIVDDGTKLWTCCRDLESYSGQWVMF